MRSRRFKMNPDKVLAVYHCMSRSVNGEKIFEPADREVLRKLVHRVADYCGVRILTYAIMPNHFHLLIEVPRRGTPSDAELLRRYKVLYPKPSPFKPERPEVIEQHLKSGSAEGMLWRKRQLALMGDISPFMKLLKQRFSIWFNRTHGRFGTLWSERFKSLLVEPEMKAMRAVAAYIDLNAVRAGLVEDPKDYRFCGYAEAVAGGRAAREGIERVAGAPWGRAQRRYRLALYGVGVEERPGKASLSREADEAVLEREGRLSLAAQLRCRLRWMGEGVALGSEGFIRARLEDYRQMTGRKRKSEPVRPPGVGEAEGLTVLNRGRNRNPALEKTVLREFF